MSDPKIPPAKLQVFLSHSHGDRAEVRALYQRLQAEIWLHPWLDEEELLPGQEWREEIEKAIEQSQAILICLTPAAITKEGFIQREIRVALEHADYMPEGTIYIIPLKLQECDAPRRLSRWQWANYFEERGHERLLKALRVRAEKLGIAIDTAPANPPIVSTNPPAAPLNPPPPIQTVVERPAQPKVNPTAVPPTPRLVERPTPAPKPAEIEQERLILELNELKTSHERRREIGDRLEVIGDTRRGVGLDANGLPDILWLSVTPGGELKIEDETFQVKPFYIAKYPITYAQYQAFVKAKDGFENLEWWKGIPKEYQKQELKEQNQKWSNHPRDNVSWYQAVAFTRWLTAHYRTSNLLGLAEEIRLPTEWEWHWAAQGGSEQRKYPWGEWKEGYANTKEANIRRTVAVGTYPQGAALCRAEDMSGNIWEWCANKPYAKIYARAVRGGSFYNTLNAASCTSQGYYANPDKDCNNEGFSNFGFRVVISSIIAPSEL